MGKGPTRTQGPGQNLPPAVKDARRGSRDLNKGMKKGGFHSGKSGYNRKEKHKGQDQSVGEELTPIDETYRGVGFPVADLNGDGGQNMRSSIAADLTWSTWKSETFDDPGKNGGHPAWGLRSVIDRGVKPHEKPSGAKRIKEAEKQVTKRNTGNGKKFKSFSHTLDWS